MKKRKTALLAFSLLTLTGIGITTLASCGGSNEITTRTVAIQGAKNGKVGDKIQLSALVFGVNDNSVTWESSDVAIASVDADGLVSQRDVLHLQATQFTDPYSGKQCNKDASRLSIQIHVDALNKGLLLIF